MGWVQLDRRFETLVAPWSSFGWDALLEKRCVVVLGEAGTGKTTEFRQRARLLAAKGSQAFYYSVEDVARAFDHPFAANATDDAYLFFDSVDEARLRSQSLERAIRNVRKALGGDLARAHLFVSCRASDWRLGDHQMLEDLVQGVEIFSIAPMNERQVKTLVATLRVADANVLLAAAKVAGAQSYLERPRDVAWLARYWTRQGTLGSLTEIVRHNIREKATEQNPDHHLHELSATDAEAAAAVLAGFAALDRRSAFELPDGELEPARDDDALDPRSVLPTLSLKTLKELLGLALFDEATYGRVRLHHRSVADYLAATWLESLLAAGLATSEVVRLVFRETAGGAAIPPELREISAWLAGMNADFAAYVLDRAPLELLQRGDPAALSVEVRREVLVRVARRRDRFVQEIDRTALRRLAHAGLAATVEELLATLDLPDELYEVLLVITAEGALANAVTGAHAFAFDARRSARVRRAAMTTVAMAGTDGDRAALVAVADAVRDEARVADVIAVLYPRWLALDRLLRLLAALDDSATSTLLRDELGERIYARTPAHDREALVAGLVALAPRSWVLGALVELAEQHEEVAETPAVRDALAPSERVRRGMRARNYEIMNRHFVAAGLSEPIREVTPAPPPLEPEQLAVGRRRALVMIADAFDVPGQAWLLEHIDELRSGQATEALAGLAAFASMRGGRVDDRLGAVAEHYGPAIADALRESWRRSWRPRPEIVSAWHHPPGALQIAVDGIELDVRAGLDWASLPGDVAVQAARFAIRARDVTSWFDALVESRPAAIAEAVCECLRVDYPAEPRVEVLTAMQHAPPSVRTIAVTALAPLVEAGDPDSPTVIRETLVLLATLPGHRAMLELLAPALARRHAALPSLFAVWWCAWFAFRPRDAVADLAGRDAPQVAAVADELATRSDRLGAEPEALDVGSLIELVGSLLAVEERNPSRALSAALARNRYLLQLVAMPGDAVYLALVRFAAAARSPERRDELLGFARQHQDDALSASPSDVVDQLKSAYAKYGAGAPAHLGEFKLAMHASSGADFAIVTALQEELDAVLAAFPEARKLDQSGNYIYYRATIPTERRDRLVYRVILCCLDKGPLGAAAATAALLATHAPRAILLVGIACGVLGTSALGDLVVADQIVDVVLGEVTPEGRDARPVVYQVDIGLLNAARSLHPAHVGTIVAGGDVVKDDGLLARYVATYPKLIGIEMEGGAVAKMLGSLSRGAPIPLLVVKAISDHGANKHDPEVLPFRAKAGASAAAFARELVVSGPLDRAK